MSASALAPEPVRGTRPVHIAAAPHRPGWLSEVELAQRWGRAPNTLCSWRNRPGAHAPIPHERYGVYVYYHIVEVWRYEQDRANHRIRPVAMRELPLPPLFATAPSDRLIESDAIMVWLLASPMSDADVLMGQVLRAKWAEVPFDERYACAYESLFWRTEHRDRTLVAEPASETPAIAPVIEQPELPLDDGIECRSPFADVLDTLTALSTVKDEELVAHCAIVEPRTEQAVTMTTTWPVRRMRDFHISAGYAIAYDDHDTTWFAPVLGGNLNTLDWQPVTPLPQPMLKVPAQAAAR